MDGEHLTTSKGRRREARGVGLIETTIAVGILLSVTVGLLSLFTLVVEQNETQGDRAARATEYAQDKLEQLMRLSFNDGATNTTIFPVSSAGGTGLGGTMAVSTTVGAVQPAAYVEGYVDYFDNLGNLVASATGALPATALYTRQWSITTDATGTLKTITVVVTAAPLRTGGVAASSTLVCVKSNNL